MSPGFTSAHTFILSEPFLSHEAKDNAMGLTYFICGSDDEDFTGFQRLYKFSKDYNYWSQELEKEYLLSRGEKYP